MSEGSLFSMPPAAPTPQRPAAPGHAALWLPIAVLACTAIGAIWLQRPECLPLSERDRTSYGLRPTWQATFDALSATCGAGLLTHQLAEYTAGGRWVLAGLGVVGALFYLAAMRQVAARLWPELRLPHVRTILAGYLGLQILLAFVVTALTRLTDANVASLDAAFVAVSAFSSLGWVIPAPGGHLAYYCAGVALLGAVGWPTWIARRRLWNARQFAGVLASYLSLLVLASLVFTALETPRGQRQGQPANRRPDNAVARLVRGAVQVTAAAGGGVPTETIPDRGLSDGTKALLAGLLLVGGIGGSAAGGVSWLAVLCVFRPRRRTGNVDTGRARLATTTLLLTMSGAVLVVAFGLLLLETQVASAFQTAPSFADALLESASAVAGGNLSTGLTATLTSANLSRGIRQSVDLYQYGLWWLMAAMFIGRLLPVWVIGRVGLGSGHARTPVAPVSDR